MRSADFSDLSVEPSGHPRIDARAEGASDGRPGPVSVGAGGRRAAAAGSSCSRSIRIWPGRCRRTWIGWTSCTTWRRGSAACRASRPPAGVPPESDEKRLGDFLLVREIGHGGMGVVYEARQVSLDRRVALEGPAVCRRARLPADRALQARSPGRRPIAPSEHRLGVRRGRRAGRALLRHAVHRRPAAGRGGPPAAGTVADGAAAGSAAAGSRDAAPRRGHSRTIAAAARIAATRPSTSGRSRGWASRRPGPCIAPTSMASCTAT